MDWKIEVITQQQCYRSIRQELLEQARNIKLMPATKNSVHSSSTELMFDIASCDIRLTDFYQRTTWRFRIKTNSAYVFEVARLDRFESVVARDTLSTQQQVRTSYRQPVGTEWEACIFRSEWEELFAENLVLKTGQCASWKPFLDTFFPPDQGKRVSAGFDEFVDIVQTVATGLSEVVL